MNANANLNATDVVAKLGLDKRALSHRRRRLFVVLAVLAVAAAIGMLVRKQRAAADVVPYETVVVARGDLVETISATGTLAPVNEVEVGSEVSGTIKTVEVDYNDTVKAGQVLARMDTSKLAAQVSQSESALEAARARVLDAEATLRESEAQNARLLQVHQLSDGKVPSRVELDAQEATVARARAGVASSKASVAQAQATLDLNRSDLEKTVVRSPIDGVVLSRQIEPGQTVAASFESPVLFELAEDLAKLELQVDVDEADVGLVRAGLDAVFTVDAYPDQHYPATILQVRYGSKTTEGVVTYTTLLRVSNDDLSLRPGMTATAIITTRQAADVLLVPNAALRFEPPRPTLPQMPRPKGSLLGSIMPHPPQHGPRPAAQSPGNGTHRQIHLLEGGVLRAVDVTIGLSDGVQTEVAGERLAPGMDVVVGTRAGTP